MVVVAVLVAMVVGAVRLLVRWLGRVDRTGDDGLRRGNGRNDARRGEFAFRGGNGGADVRAQEMGFGGGERARGVEALNARSQRGEARENGRSVSMLGAGAHAREHCLERARVARIQAPRARRSTAGERDEQCERGRC
jgi:hypothetical protein